MNERTFPPTPSLRARGQNLTYMMPSENPPGNTILSVLKLSAMPDQYVSGYGCKINDPQQLEIAEE